jgi:hypothetical protein
MLHAADIAAAAEQQQMEPVKLVSLLYSQQHILYRIPSMARGHWLSVKVYPLPESTERRDEIYLGPSLTADGQGWRKAYSAVWCAILQGDVVTVPEDDPMVRDYAAFEIKPLRPGIDTL